MRRVVITGLGTVNPLGNDVETSFRRMVAGENGVVPIPNFDTSGFTTHIAAKVQWTPEDHFSKPELRKLDPFTMWALMATREAQADAGLELKAASEDERERFGCIIATGIGGITGIEEQFHVLLEKGPRRISPHFIPRIMANAVAGQVAIENGLLGTAFTTSSACASAGHAIGMALRSIQSGESDVVVTGGAESATTPLGLSGFCAAKALSTRNDEPERASRPFDRQPRRVRDGGGLPGSWCFEELEQRARRTRGATDLRRGWWVTGSTADAFHITAPKEDGAGPARAMTRALRDAGIDPTDVDYVNAHGTSTKYNDAIETRAIKRSFGDHAKKLAISSTKSMVGHLLGASSAIELVATAMSVSQGVVHPTRNLENPDPECDLDYVPQEGRDLRVRNALSNSLGFGGHNVSICIGQLAD